MDFESVTVTVKEKPPNERGFEKESLEVIENQAGSAATISFAPSPNAVHSFGCN